MTMIDKEKNRSRSWLANSTAMLAAICFLLVSFATVAQAAKEVTKDGKKFIEIDGQLFPALAPLGPPGIPADNPQSVDADGWPLKDDPKVKLGFMLFFEPALTGDGSLSCMTCHKPDEGWGLNSAVSRGYPGISHWRNSHTLVNSAYQGKLFWDGHSLSLETQAPSAAQGLSGNGKADMMEARLRLVPEYVKMFKEAFGSDNNVVKDSWRAIAAWERTMTTPNTPLDRYLRGETDALDEQQVRGKEIFEGKGRCIMCHNGALTSDEAYYNLEIPLQESFTEDHLQQTGHRSQTYIRGVPEYIFRKTKSDTGLYLSSHNKEDLGKFRTQPLRYMEFTPPFMHNGVFDTLEDVIDFYNDGGGDDSLPGSMKSVFGVDNKTKILKKLDLTDEEKEDLVAFLEGMTGDEIILPNPVLPRPPAIVEVKKKK